MSNQIATQADMTVANGILAQLGGNQFIAMTGAKNLLGDKASLQFRLPRGAKGGCNAVKVTLDVTDTYTVVFYKIGRGTYDVTELASVSMVYIDTLRAIFESHTGLRTRLF